jgi:site-specific DNA recombinase
MRHAARNRAIIYRRVSTDSQTTEEGGMSLATQQEKLKAYCVANDLVVAAEFEDAGLSGKTMEERPGLQSALRMLTAGDADILLVVRLCRLSRNTQQTLALAERCQREGWALASLSERLDTTTAAGRLSLSLLASLNQYEREKIGETVKQTMLFMSRQNRRTGAVPYGFSLDPTDPERKRLVPNDEQQEALRRIKRWKRIGHSYRNICDRLRRLGFKTAEGNTDWDPKSVWNVLAREAKLATR